MKLNEKRIVASFELIVMITSMFAFSYFLYSSRGVVDELDKLYEVRDKLVAEKIAEIKVKNQALELPKKEVISLAINSFIKKMNEPIIPTVSAQENGCCSLSSSGEKCKTTTEEECTGQFAEGAVCASTSFCQKGCCFDEGSGAYDKNVLKSDCPSSWVGDPNCNMPAANLGCCVLGTSTTFETEGQCEVDTISRALGNGTVVDWDGGLDEAGCLARSMTQKEGACVLAGKACKFVTETDCLNYKGQFSEGYLCTSPKLGASCNMTEQTTCVDGKDGVYFVDSCGNPANIYDSTRKSDLAYWDKVIAPEEICGNGDILGGNAKSPSCGNCNRFMGGICSSASEDNIKVNLGNFYCKDTSCTYMGSKYKNGESWCVYDGKIGDGDDVVGSRHWKYVCSQGAIQIEPCADYRNQICIQSDTLGVNDTEVEFRNAVCIANNWRECIDLNSQKEGLEKCEKTINCRLERVAIADQFKFSMCTPKYPGGFNLSDERYLETAQKICAMADQTCKVLYKAKTWGGCELAANGGCLKEGFAQGMNDVCRKLGDCGGEVNILGTYTSNHKVEESSDLSETWISKLVAMATPVAGQYANVEDYSEFLEAAGLIGDPADPTVEKEKGPSMMSKVAIAAGTGGLVWAAGSALASSVAVGPVTASGATAAIPGSAGMAGFAGAAMGAGIGMMVGFMIAKQMGLSPGGSILMGIGGAMIGASLAMTMITGMWWCLPCLMIGLVLLLIAMYFKAKCEAMNKDVKFTCKPWEPPTGGDDCEKCNADPLKPCSEYRCKSLGAACELINVGMENETCHSIKDDGTAPTLNPQLGVISENETYSDISKEGFRITSTDGECIKAYTPLTFGVVTNELSHCKFDVAAKSFAEMNYDLGGASYQYNHTTTFTLPDPSHGQSQGSNWTGGLTFYVKCQDAFGHENPEFYTINSCVKEGPDKTAPVIRALNPENNKMVGFGATSQNFSVVTNELANCKWDSADVSYEAMMNVMTCGDEFGRPSLPQGYLCKGNLAVGSGENKYYIRCMDQPWLDSLNRSSERNANQEGTLYILKRSDKKITIDWIEPSKDFETNTEVTTINLEVQTSGGGEWHFCSYSFSGYDKMIEMFETGDSKIHKQPLNRPAGTDKIYVKCTDETEDFVQAETEFKIIYDTSSPQIARVWQEGGLIHITTTEDAECVYTTEDCRYSWDKGDSMGNGKEHTITAVVGKKYYIKCRDEYLNTPRDCSLVTQVVE
jgi:hypothetical protein